MILLCFGCATAGATGDQSAPTKSSGPFVSQKLAVVDRGPTGFTVEVQLVLDNPGTSTMRIRTANYTLSLADAVVAKGELPLDLTAEAGERQGVVVPIKVDLGNRAGELGAGDVNLRASGKLNISQKGDRELPFTVMLDVPGQNLLAR